MPRRSISICSISYPVDRMPKLPNLVDLVPGDTESLSRRTQRGLANHKSYTDGNVDIATHGDHPFLAATLDSGPVVVPDLGLTFFVRTEDFPGHVAVLQERFHPGQLKPGRFRRKMSITSSCISKPTRRAYRLDKISGTFRVVAEDGRLPLHASKARSAPSTPNRGPFGRRPSLFTIACDRALVHAQPAQGAVAVHARCQGHHR